MRKFTLVLLLILAISNLTLFPRWGSALQQNYYANICPNVESIVRGAVTQKFQEPLMLLVPPFVSSSTTASLRVVMALDLIALAGGPSYAVELGRFDGLSSTAGSVVGKLPAPTFDLDQLTGIFGSNGLSMLDMIVLSACHTVGFAHCGIFSDRLYNFAPGSPMDPTLNKNYAAQLISSCPPNPNPSWHVFLDPVTPGAFDNQYFKNLQQGMGLLFSDQVLFNDTRSQSTVNSLASSSSRFEQAFVVAITNMGRVGVKTGLQGNIRENCRVFN
uniref:Plant heme peroxidase family profile domain-containing protein n=1 Tax=Ananas comosus var. bracteatus TaxID=296719 RepID=A0A6V7NLL3_ANACO|nr:unnamed protein product [Ananas comosus var. bracteatus]